MVDSIVMLAVRAFACLLWRETILSSTVSALHRNNYAYCLLLGVIIKFMEQRAFFLSDRHKRCIPDFYIDDFRDLPETRRIELVRVIDIQARASEIFVWLSQFRVAPYSYDLLDNCGCASPGFVIKNLPPIQKREHFLLAFNMETYKENLFVVCRFCEPIIFPFNLAMKRLFMEYRLVEHSD